MRPFDLVEAKRIFAETDAIVTNDHLVYAKKSDGWYHGYDYVNKDAIYPYVEMLDRLCFMLAYHCKDMNIQTVVGPTVGGALLSQRVTSILMNLSGKRCWSVFADEVEGRRVIKRGYGKFIKGVRCLLVEDVINTGKTVVDTNQAVIDAGGQVVYVAALCNRSGGKVNAQTLGVPQLVSLLDLDMQMFKEEECPICKERGLESVRTDLGKGTEFLVRKGLKK